MYLAQRGMKVAVHYNTSEGPAQDVVAEIEAMGGQAVALGADLLNEDAVLALGPTHPPRPVGSSGL